MASKVIKVLVLCKTYPSPSAKYSETSCVAGLTEDGGFIRLFPIPFRLIADDQQFRKWQWIEARVEKAHDDHRPESHRVFVDTIRVVNEPLQAGKKGWPLRMELLHKAPSFPTYSSMELARQETGCTLALLRPKRVVQLEIKPVKNVDWSAEELTKLTQWQQQDGLFDIGAADKDVKPLEKLPVDVYYHCEFEGEAQTETKRIKLVDWEVGALYRNLRRQHGRDGWERFFRKKYGEELPSRDLTLMLGTVHRFPDQWLAVSAFAPHRPGADDEDQASLF